MGASLNSSTNASSAHFGGADYWIVKLTSSGIKQWSRSYGGAGDDFLSAIAQTEDAGFLVAGSSSGSGVTGNKTVDGDGVWILKLDSSGLKEAESLIPGNFGSRLLSKTGSYRLTVWDYNVTNNVWRIDLMTVRNIRLSAQSTGRAYNIDVSTDLLNWTNVLRNFNGDIQLTERMLPTWKFFRATVLE